MHIRFLQLIQRPGHAPAARPSGPMRLVWAVALLFVLAGCGRKPATVDTAATCSAYAATAPEYDPGTPPPGWKSTLTTRHLGQSLTFGPIDGHYWRWVGQEQICGLHYNRDHISASEAPDGLLLYYVEGHLVHLPIPPQAIPQPEDPDRIVQVVTEEFPELWLGPPRPPGYVYWHGLYDTRNRVATATGFWLRHTALTAFTFDMGGEPDYPFVHQVKPGIDFEFAPKLNFDAGP